MILNPNGTQDNQKLDAETLAKLGILTLADFTFSTTDPGAGSAATTKFYAVYKE